ncbi:Hypothetical predicted protein [Pelobates cultripes]|uniref:Uncharacterized protein n=1 Tax=Pelobates cultripes TaxID=61616 RepID=A0AAD1TJJ9_PELCU|nr:Hypothetical predicted protein [Pelobates cultripes]
MSTVKIIPDREEPGERLETLEINVCAHTPDHGPDASICTLARRPAASPPEQVTHTSQPHTSAAVLPHQC